ncbi:MAG: sigma-54 dependent transcriptional regulator [Candidatus Kapabacteria bacterium]|nr:sigma-54 dependent transcriptional regulator [Candidatus Kapabacteria bacterium]MDW8011517.1 sigma-54 dependent transcriptional regulator [Bacteroidota bacterium]
MAVGSVQHHGAANYTILLLEDDPDLGEMLQRYLEQRYRRVYWLTDLPRAVVDFPRLRPDLVLLDIFLGQYSGLELLERLREEGFATPVIVMTAFSDLKMAVRAVKLGAEDFVVKPIDIEQLEIAVERALRNYELRRQVQLLEEQLRLEQPHDIIAVSESLRSILGLARMLAAVDTTVLIVGETGTGKELLARFIHRNSARASAPFVVINCGAIPRELAESELFGYERGAFTGAFDKVHPGKFELANRGTLFLDEVSELPLELQVKLLRVLQEKSFYRLGGKEEVQVDVRVIAATNRDLEQMVREGRFREDLYYRLNVAVIHIPPLRERPEDILPLATAFVDEFNRRFNKRITGFTPEAVSLLMSYPWRGNVRELRNAIERAVLLEQSDVITRETLHFLRVRPWVEGSPDDVFGMLRRFELPPGRHFLAISPHGVSYDEVIKDLIQQALTIARGNVTKAAKLLRITRDKLEYRMRVYGIDPSQFCSDPASSLKDY